MTLIFMYNSLRAAVAAIATLGLAGGLLAACGSGDSAGAGTGHVEVVAAFYPLEYVTKQVGGDHVSVTNLVKPGVEPHDLELNPRQVGSVNQADLVVYLRGFQPAVDQAVTAEAKDRALDAATVAPLLQDHTPIEGGEAHRDDTGADPHIWLDPTRLAAVADAVAARLGTADPGHAADFTRNATELRTRLTALDDEYRTGLAHCASRSIVTSHNAFGYLAQRYDLTQIGITGLTPETEPTAGRLAEVARIAKREKVDVIFFETLVSPKIAETLASEIGAKAEVLDPLEGLKAGSDADYISVMRANLATLRSALGCS
jgi:zinc transport system substrate-binding protein